MIETTSELLTLLIVILVSIWLCYRSRLSVLEVQAFSVNSHKQNRYIIDNMQNGVKGLREFNSKLEEFNKQNKIKNQMCKFDLDSECRLCDGNCPFKKKDGGE